MIGEHEIEPIPGLPGVPPAGERVLWQGSPAWRALARDAFHTRIVALYFAVLVLAALATGAVTGAIMTVAAGLAAQCVLHLLAWAIARSTIYTLTDRRIVLRIGVALPKCLNLPLALVQSVDLNARADGTGDVVLMLEAGKRLGYAWLWPHARAWHLAKPQPMLRAVPDAARAGALIARTCLAAQPAVGHAPATMPASAPDFIAAVAA